MFRLASIFAAIVLGVAACAWGGEVVLVLSGDAAPYAQTEAAARKVLTDSGRNVRTMPLKAVAEQGVGGEVGRAEAVIAVGTQAAMWLHKQLPQGTPLIYCMVSGPVGMGLTSGRVTHGVTIDVALEEQFHLIGDALRNVRTVGMLYRPDNAASMAMMEAAKAALPEGWRLEAVAVDGQAGVAAAIEELCKRRIDMIWTSADPAVYDGPAVRALLLASLRARIAVWGFSPAFVRSGAILGVGLEPAAQGEQVAKMTQLVLTSSARKKALIEAPKVFQISVNLIVAEKLGVEISPAIVQRAAQVFRAEN